ncbi:hypothetical protein GX586_07805, partial [bacterium]|nr:hypothetical protein [bacterium]
MARSKRYPVLSAIPGDLECHLTSVKPDPRLPIDVLHVGHSLWRSGT